MSETPTAERAAPFSVGVRAFCAFVAKSGDLDHRFTPAPSAEEGMAGHRFVVARRGPGYQQEVALEATVKGLRLRGRVDGLDADADALEEIKTFRGDLASMPDNHRALHRAQLQTYGALYCLMHGRQAVDLRLVYFDVDRREEQIETLDGDAGRLVAITEARAAEYLEWARALEAHRQERDLALRTLPFPHATVPAGQRQLMEAVDEAMEQGQTLLAQAPTGVGKTLGVLVPALRALGRGAVDRLFYLTAKTSTQFEAQKALDQLQPANRVLPLRVLTLTSREKACEHPDKACHGASCPLARGFFDRLPAARIAARALPALRPDTLRATAARHQLCPYYLGQEMARWADIVIGDLHYYFDRSALLYALSLQNRWRPGVLIDEAHNLIERARSMYSAAIAQTPLREAGRGAPADVRQALARLDRCLDDLAPQDEAAAENADTAPPETPPEPLVQALNKSVAALGSHLNTTGSHTEPELLQRYFELLAVQRLAEEFGRHALCDITVEAARSSDLFGTVNTQFAIHNVIPAPHLAPAIHRARALVGFSATLTPPEYHQRMWGLPDARFRWCDAPSAFADGQLRVRTVTRIPTRMPQRRASAPRIATLIATQFHYRPGNYLAFFSSFAYLQAVAEALARLHPDVPQRRQSSAMSDAQRSAFVQDFEHGGRGVAFAVLGGAFGEGIDLPGDRLTGVFVTTLGIPPVTPFRDRMAAQVERSFGEGSGWPFVYLYPGLQKVIQAVGRTIRTQDDEGVAILIDPRYGRPDIRALLPPAWQAPAATGNAHSGQVPLKGESGRLGRTDRQA